MLKRARIIDIVVVGLFCVAIASSAAAQATRTWVSGVGDDVNPCSRTAPCKTFAGAISKTASPGEIDVLDPGGFGAVTITKSITIDGGAFTGGVLASGTQGIVISAGLNDVVTLRNIVVDGAGSTLGTNGIAINSAKAVHIEHCNIYNFSQYGILDNRTTNTSLAQLFVNDSSIHTNGNGISVAGFSNGRTTGYIDNSRIQGNTGFGVAVSNSNIVNVSHCQVSGNGGEGVKVDTNSAGAVVGSVLFQNLTGALNNGFVLLLADTTIVDNNTGVSGTITTFGNNNVRQNIGGNTLPAPVGQQ